MTSIPRIWKVALALGMGVFWLGFVFPSLMSARNTGLVLAGTSGLILCLSWAVVEVVRGITKEKGHEKNSGKYQSERRSGRG